MKIDREDQTHGDEELSQTPEDRLLILAQSLGFAETAEMMSLRQEISGPDALVEDLGRYQYLATEELRKKPEIQKEQIGLALASASICHKFGDYKGYRDAMGAAIIYSSNMGYEDVVRDLIEKQTEIFREDYKRGLSDLFVLVEQISEPLSPDPGSMGIDDRTFEELMEWEKKEAEKVIYEELRLEIDKLNEVVVREYTTQAVESARVPGEIKVRVFETNKDGMFLQELTFKDNEKRWVVGPDQDI